MRVLPELVALSASFFTALSSVMATRGMKDSNPDTANLILTGIQTIVLTGLLALDFPELNVRAILWFSLAGIFGSFIGRLLTMMSYKQLGVSSSSALIGTSPVLTTFLAVIFLNEPLVWSVIVGAFLLFIGISVLNSLSGQVLLTSRNLYLPVGAAFFYAISNVIQKLGTNLQPNAILGAQVSTFAGLLACLTYLAAGKSFGKLQINRGNINWLAGSGVVNAAAWVMITMAISLGRVSVITPLIYSYPLFSLILSRLFISDEVINRTIVFGSVLVVIGVVIVSIFA